MYSKYWTIYMAGVVPVLIIECFHGFQIASYALHTGHTIFQSNYTTVKSFFFGPISTEYIKNEKEFPLNANLWVMTSLTRLTDRTIVFQSFVSTPKIGISLLAVVGIVKQWFILVRPVRHLKLLSHIPNSLLKPSSKNEIHRQQTKCAG